MNKPLKNEVVYTVLDKKHIIKCICLDYLIPIDDFVYDVNYASFHCCKTRVIKVYDSDENIIFSSIIVPRYKYSLEKGSIISLENFNKKKRNIYFKNFLRAYMVKNRINNIKYNINLDGKINGFGNSTIDFYGISDIFILKEFKNYATFYYKNKITHYLYEDNMNFDIIYFSNELYNYRINTYDNKINITKTLKKKIMNSFYEQSIICDRKLRILQLLIFAFDKILYEENRDENGKIISIKEYNNSNNKMEIIFYNNINKSILMKSKETFSQELINFYNLNIEQDLRKLSRLKNNELCKAQELLSNEIKKHI